MITGAIPTEDKMYCQSFINKKYNDYLDGHATPIGNRIKLEVYVSKKDIRTHNLKRHDKEFVEIEMPMNDR